MASTEPETKPPTAEDDQPLNNNDDDDVQKSSAESPAEPDDKDDEKDDNDKQSSHDVVVVSPQEETKKLKPSEEDDTKEESSPAADDHGDTNPEEAAVAAVAAATATATEAVAAVAEDDGKPETNKEEPPADDDENDKKTKESPTAKENLPPRPVKRARTAYFVFTDEKRPKVQSEHPGEGVANVARVMGQMWSALSAEEKEVYQQTAALERERVAKELEEWKAAGGQIETEGSEGGVSKDGLVFPVARIRKICKLDPEVRGLSKEALWLVTKCAELATAKLGTEAVRVARLQNRRKLLPDDVAHVCAHREQFLFLKDDVKDLVRTMAEASSSSDAKAPGAKKVDAARDAAAAGTKPLTAYFGASNKK